MNFTLDDPLADLLSDNSYENDSFFDSQSGKNKKNTNRPSTAASRTSAGKGKLENLFGIKEESEPQFKVPPIRSNVVPSIRKEEKPLATSTPKLKANTSDENVDLGFDPKNPKSPGSQKPSTFLDDILSSMDSKKSSGLNKSTEQIQKREPISRQSTETTENSGTAQVSQVSRPKTSTGRRSSTASPAKMNTLDLFSKDNDNSRQLTPQIPKKADWLGLGNESEEIPENIEVVKSSESLPKADILKIDHEEVEPEPEPPTSTEPEPINTEVSVAPMPIANPTIPYLVTAANLGTHNAQIIDQQVAQLSLASQMKNQENTLMQMQRRQYELISRQEAQFNDLLKKQISRQNQLEQTIQAQQERINTHIQLLLKEPLGNGYPLDNYTPDNKNIDVPALEHSQAFIELQADVKRLELEKLRLEDLISKINTNYENEIELIEKSFKKQIEVSEENLKAVETRLKSENEALTEFYSNKLKIAENEREEIQSRLETALVNLRKSHEEEIERLKRTHEENIEGLKEDHRKMIETIRQSKLLEFASVEGNTSYLDILRHASANLESVTGDFQSLRSEIERKIDVIHKERVMKLDMREKKLEETEKRIKSLETANEEDKNRLMDLVTTLERQLQQLFKDSSEEKWIMRQKMASLEAEKAAFEKEKALAREQITKDEKRVEELKESQLQEVQKQMEQVQEERNKLDVEKAIIKTAKKLEPSFNIEKSRQELEASMKVAQDVARQAECERERFFKLQRQFETQKRTLVDKENAIRLKEQELEQEIQEARSTERKYNDSAQRARMAEQSFNEKVAFLQQKLRQISEKETFLSQERLQLSQERIDLQNTKTKLEQNRCSLCRIGERNAELTQVLTSESIIIDGIPIIDDQSFIVERSSYDVDRFLDEKVSISLERLKNNAKNNWTEEELIIETTTNADPTLLDYEYTTQTNGFHKN